MHYFGLGTGIIMIVWWFEDATFVCVNINISLWTIDMHIEADTIELGFSKWARNNEPVMTVCFCPWSDLLCSLVFASH